MLKNYLKTGFRSLIKQKIYTIINLAGLSIGIAGCLLIMLYVQNEYSYDKFHENAENIYKMVLERIYPDHVTNYAFIPHTFTDVMIRDFPEIKNAVRVVGGFGNVGNNGIIVRYVDDDGEEKVFEEMGFAAADSTFFDIFSIKLIKGDPEDALFGQQKVVITEETALKYFGDEDPLNKTLETDLGEYKVTGVCENVPDNSHMDFDFLGTVLDQPFMQNENFVAFSAHVYLELEEGADPGALEAKFPKMVETYAAPQIEQRLNTGYEAYIAAGNGYNYSLLPLKDVYLEPTPFEGEFKSSGSRHDLYILISVAALILIIACINFMNLATARSTERAKEVGIRKTLGSQRQQLVGQFLVESVLLSLFASLIALGLVYLVLPEFNQLAGKQLQPGLLDSGLVLYLILFTVFVGFAAGSYPAFILSAFNPAVVIKGSAKSDKKKSWLRNGLVIFQFAISIVLLASTLVVKRQMDFVQGMDLGFDKEQMLVIEHGDVLEQQQGSFMEELRQIPGVKAVGASAQLLAGQYFGIQFMPRGASEPITTNAIAVDDDYIEAMGLSLIDGRGFSRDFEDSLAVVINQQTVDLLGVDDPVGLKLNNTALGDPPITREYTVVGVVKNFHYMSLRDEISPFVLLSTEGAVQPKPFMSVKVDRNPPEVITSIEEKWKTLAPQEPFKYTFLDDELNELYASESKSGKLFGVFATLAIAIACVGLFGLAAYTAGLRTKEIGIRKVMGASVFSVTLMLSFEFTKLILIAFLLAVPIAWYFMDSWLNIFAYQVDIGIWVFLLSGLAALVIAWLTVSYQSIKAAIVNPVKSLRSE